ncbi:MAG: site-2 protease family protein [Clostridia bacterium]|nr:site-2 protease family protein [Clostridia bacterium]
MPDIVYYVLSALAVLITLTVHEYAHGYTAYKLGDPTARNLGRLSLNPIRHLDPIGAVCMILFHFGWAKPVPINPRNFKNPKRDFAITALAGPLSNIILAFFSSFLYLLLLSVFKGVEFKSEFAFQVASNGLSFVYLFHIINIGLGLFNLLPVPPLDGSRLLTVILPQRLYFKIMDYERKIYLGLILWLLLGDFVTRTLLLIPAVAESPVLSTVAGLFSLSDLLSSLFKFISDAMMNFWQLIPFLKI